MNEADQKALHDILKRHVAQLEEHFESVQIICTKPVEGGGTACVQEGSGNWYARYGALVEVTESFELQMNVEEDDD